MPPRRRQPIDLEKMAKQIAGAEAQKRQLRRGTGAVKNKQPSQMQITSEQILREAIDRQEPEARTSFQKIADVEELLEYRNSKRREFEDNIRKNRYKMNSWSKYAQWEEAQLEFERARSIFERALDVDYRNVGMWLRYTEMEMRHKFVNHARNIWDRAVALLPRVDQLWYKYAHMEEMLANIGGARQIFERWLAWHPGANAWKAFAKLEVRYREFERARAIFERYVKVHGGSVSGGVSGGSGGAALQAWMDYAKFEEKYGSVEQARGVFERALAVLGARAYDEQFLVRFAKFEEGNGEVERARVIYKFALDNIPRHHAHDLYRTFVAFEKQFGDRKNIEEVVSSKQRFRYEEELKSNPHNYDVWFDYIRLEEGELEQQQQDDDDEKKKKKIERTREVYERAIANVPLLQEKRYWRRYIYFWINYAIFEELVATSVERTREVYTGCIKLIPHKLFSFSKIWIMFARFELRQKNIDAARSIFGHAIGMAPKDKIFKEYIKMELLLGNIDRVRKLYEKYLEWSPGNCNAWKQFAELETKLEEIDRARAIYNLAIGQSALDLPEVVWKSFIDFEIAQKNHENVLKLYEDLLSRTKHVKVWVSYATYEATVDHVEDARKIFERAEKYFKSGSVEEDAEATEAVRKEQRVMLMEAWQKFEETYGTPESKQEITAKMPKRIKKKRRIVAEDGTTFAGWEEYYDYVFPSEEAPAKTNLKLLEMAYKWKQQQAQQQ